MKGLLHRREAAPILLVVAAFIAGVIESPYFLDLRYLLDSSSLYVETGLLALGMTLVVISAEIDLSVASTMALVACLSAKMVAAGWSPWVALPAAPVIGALLGCVNGALVGYLRLPSFLVTLATLAAYRGAAQVMLGANSISLPAKLVGLPQVKPLGLPAPLILFGAFAVIAGLLLHRTVLGRWIYTVGTNERAARYSGVPTSEVKLFVFALSGFLAGCAALLINSRLGVARFDDVQGLELDVVTVVVLGGTAITGGSGTVLGSAIALLLVGLVRTGMGLANVTAEYQLAAVGTLLVVAVAVTQFTQRRASIPG